jgi:aryl-alcohol dehydrogenase-like predicted oxidoreductase
MTFGEDWGWGASAEESRRMFRTFVDRGGNFVDTANMYTNGTAELILGELIAPERPRIVLSTKYTLSMDPEDPNAFGSHRKSLVQSVEASLRRLRTDYIDVLWVHAFDPLTPIDEVMRSLDDIVRTGKALYVGVSDWPAWAVSRANTIAELRAWTPFIGIQLEYSLIARTVERELLPMARAFELAVMPWGTTGGGLLSGKYRGRQATDSKRAAVNTRRVTERTLAIAEEVKQIAAARNLPPTQVAIAWAIQRAGENVVPLIGARTAAQLSENLSVVDVQLSAEELDRLDSLSEIELGFPADFLAVLRSSAFGKRHAQTIDHRRR